MYNQNETQDKLDWMYKGANSLVDREEYLLGRKIDKTLEQINLEEKQKDLGVTQPKNHVEHECIPPSIRDYKLQVGDQVDLQTKLQEDPLVVIKKREEETRRQFLQNPIQLKKLQTALSKHAKKKNKKKKKKLKDDDIDALIAKKLKRLRNNSLDESDEEENLEKVLLKKLHKYKSKLTENDLKEIFEGKKSNEGSDNDSDFANTNVQYKHSKSDSDDSYNAFAYKKRRNVADKSKFNTKEFANKQGFIQTERNVKLFSNKKALTGEEKERKLREMMANASWRDTERVKNVKRYKEQDSTDSKNQSKYNPDFIHKELLKSANSSSVESRIKANINSIQRSRHDMNTNFSKR